METVRLAFDNFYFVVHPFDFSCVKGEIALVDNAVAMPVEHLGEFVQNPDLEGPGQIAPVVQSLGGPCPGAVGPYVLELVPEDHDLVDRFVEFQQFFELPAHVFPVFQQQVLGSLEDGLVPLGGLFVFDVSDLVDHASEGGHDVEKVEYDFGVGQLFPYGFDERIPHVYYDGFNGFALPDLELVEKPGQGLALPVFAHMNDATRLVAQNDGEVLVALAQGDFVHGQDSQPLAVGLSEIALQKVLVDGLDRFPVQVRMSGHFGDGHRPAQLMDVPGEPVGNPPKKDGKSPGPRREPPGSGDIKPCGKGGRSGRWSRPCSGLEPFGGASCEPQRLCFHRRSKPAKTEGRLSPKGRPPLNMVRLRKQTHILGDTGCPSCFLSRQFPLFGYN